MAISTGAGKPYKSFRDVLESAKAKPDAISIGNVGNGSLGHLASILVSQAAGVKLVPVPYKGGGPLHTDALRETWRLHIPIITNPNCFFEWQRADGSIESVHLPADGSAWLVRVDLSHRAVNRSNEPSTRVHLLMGLSPGPDFSMLAEPRLPVLQEAPAAAERTA